VNLASTNVSVDRGCDLWAKYVAVGEIHGPLESPEAAADAGDGRYWKEKASGP